jgi:hypothetical protein
MSKPDVVAVLDFATWFDVKRSKNSSSGWACGEDTVDCQGALHMLCARNVTTLPPGPAAYAQWWGFEDCLMGNQTAIPGNAAHCARKR